MTTAVPSSAPAASCWTKPLVRPDYPGPDLHHQCDQMPAQREPDPYGGRRILLCPAVAGTGNPAAPAKVILALGSVALRYFKGPEAGSPGSGASGSPPEKGSPAWPPSIPPIFSVSPARPDRRQMGRVPRSGSRKGQSGGTVSRVQLEQRCSGASVCVVQEKS